MRNLPAVCKHDDYDAIYPGRSRGYAPTSAPKVWAVFVAVRSRKDEPRWVPAISADCGPWFSHPGRAAACLRTASLLCEAIGRDGDNHVCVGLYVSGDPARIDDDRIEVACLGVAGVLTDPDHTDPYVTGWDDLCEAVRREYSRDFPSDQSPAASTAGRKTA